MRRERKEYEDMYRMGKMLMDAEKVEEDKPDWTNMANLELYAAIGDVMDDIEDSLEQLGSCPTYFLGSIVKKLSNQFEDLKAIQKEMLHRGILRRR